MGKVAMRFRVAGLALLAHPSSLAWAQSATAESPGSKKEDVTSLEEVVVTGSHIRGAEVAGSKVILISREQIDASGFGRIEDVLATVTQNFNRANAAVSEAVSEPGLSNLNHGAEVQL